MGTEDTARSNLEKIKSDYMGVLGIRLKGVQVVFSSILPIKGKGQLGADASKRSTCAYMNGVTSGVVAAFATGDAPRIEITSKGQDPPDKERKKCLCL